MEAFQQRVVDERSDLEDKLRRLMAFLGTPAFVGLPAEEQERMRRQAVAMRAYSDVLGERIAAFGRVNRSPRRTPDVLTLALISALGLALSMYGPPLRR